MSNFHDKAVALRAQITPHINCAQAVVVPFAEAAGVSDETAMRFAGGFGGGMRRASVCGAITGGIMALGLFGLDDPKILAEYHQILRERHDGMLECADLLRANKAAGREKKPHCDAMVLECVDLVEEILQEYGKLPKPQQPGKRQMTIEEAIQSRHSVRKYTDEPMAPELIEKLNAEIKACNEESGLKIQLLVNEPKCFDNIKAYGAFKNAVNYIAMVGDRTREDFYETCGYYGERLVLFAETLGLRTCWVAGSFGKGLCKAKRQVGEKTACVISIGYAEREGRPHVSKPIEKVCNVKQEDMPEWFRKGVDAALLAPTAINQQQFMISLEDGEPVIRAKYGPYSRIDLGIVKYHFEIASGRKCK